MGLRPIHLGALIVASMIGSGVFTTSGFALADLGSPHAVLLAWALGAVHAALGAASYGWLAARVPESGGEYVILQRTMHPAAAYVVGWVSLLAGFTAPIAAAAHGLEAYLQREGALWIGATAIVGSAALHGIRRDLGAGLQTAAVALKLLLLFGFLALGLGSLDHALLAAPTEARWEKLGATLVWISFSFSGWNAAIYLAGETRGKPQHLARWSVAAVVVVGALYLGLNAVFVFAAPPSELAGRPDIGVAAASALGGSALARALSLVVALALLTSVSSMMMAGPRVLWKMGRDGALPRVLGRGEHTPHVAIAVQGVLALVVFFVSTLRELLGYIGLTLSVSSALTVTALLLEYRRGRIVPRTRALLVIPVAYIMATLLMAAWLAWLEPMQALASAGTLGMGLLVYGAQKRRDRSPDERPPDAVDSNSSAPASPTRTLPRR